MSPTSASTFGPASGSALIEIALRRGRARSATAAARSRPAARSRGTCSRRRTARTRRRRTTGNPHQDIPRRLVGPPAATVVVRYVTACRDILGVALDVPIVARDKILASAYGLHLPGDQRANMQDEHSPRNRRFAPWAGAWRYSGYRRTGGLRRLDAPLGAIVHGEAHRPPVAASHRRSFDAEACSRSSVVTRCVSVAFGT